MNKRIAQSIIGLGIMAYAYTLGQANNIHGDFDDWFYFFLVGLVIVFASLYHMKK